MRSSYDFRLALALSEAGMGELCVFQYTGYKLRREFQMGQVEGCEPDRGGGGAAMGVGHVGCQDGNEE